MESEILLSLDFNLHFATEKVFLRRFLRAAAADIRSSVLLERVTLISNVSYFLFYFLSKKN
jgi:hypothetical protein